MLAQNATPNSLNWLQIVNTAIKPEHWGFSLEAATHTLTFIVLNEHHITCAIVLSPLLTVFCKKSSIIFLECSEVTLLIYHLGMNMFLDLFYQQIFKPLKSRTVIISSLYFLVLSQCLAHNDIKNNFWNEWIYHQLKFNQIHKKRIEIVQLKSN